MQTADYHTLFSQYIAICNQALEKNQDKFPFKQIWDSAQQHEKGEVVDVQIIDDYSTPHFRLKLEQNQIKEATCPSAGKCCGGCVKRHWQIQASYLQHVIQNAEDYIDNPAMINWEWLQPDID